jgi:hypothetical protein
MSSRFLIPLLCTGAVVFACSPRSDNEAKLPQSARTSVASAPTTPAAPRQQGSPLATSQKSPVAAQIHVRSSEANIRFSLRVVNTSKKRLEITFPSGQTYDFVVLDSVGREMWRWGSDRMFTQALRNKPLGAGETLDFEETLKALPLPPGRYVARATLTSANYPLTEQTEFTIAPTTVASR